MYCKLINTSSYNFIKFQKFFWQTNPKDSFAGVRRRILTNDIRIRKSHFRLLSQHKRFEYSHQPTQANFNSTIQQCGSSTKPWVSQRPWSSSPCRPTCSLTMRCVRSTTWHSSVAGKTSAAPLVHNTSGSPDHRPSVAISASRLSVRPSTLSSVNDYASCISINRRRLILNVLSRESASTSRYLWLYNT